MFKLIIIVLGIVITSLGLVNILFYANLLLLGYSIFNFLIFIFTNFYTLLFWMGIVMIYFGKKIK